MNPGILLGLTLGIACSIIWGGHAVVARPALAGQGFHPLDLAAFRYAPGALLLAPFAWRARATLARIGWRRLLVLAFFGGAPNLLLFVCALLYAPASHGGTIAPMVTPIAGALLAIPLIGEWPSRGRAVALAVMGMGVLMIGWDGVAGDHPGAWRGDILLLLAGATWSVFTVLLRRWQVPAIPATAAVTIISASVVLPVWLPWRAAEMAAIPTGPLLVQLAAQGIALGTLAMFLYARAVELLGPTRAATLSIMVPVTALLLAGLLLNEPISLLQVSGATLAAGGMLAAVLFTGRKTA
ncbi:DMT family transporter [Roseomonas terrae]|jgi:drug/metabolite transporter (DMT)-like permease|uniref:DMT family transporter n=1 Tax=Neoroseomonas terrae TaxID=424799 RepID=A0ABS5EPF5_9PROT|nr:DMT family transporter [Neoroseomonas terrae]MBR0652916.1 DMT family transporter [Neoroseomonas terrae]